MYDEPFSISLYDKEPPGTFCAKSVDVEYVNINKATVFVWISNKLENQFRTPMPGFSLLECYRQKSVYWSSSWCRILNVFDVYYLLAHRRCWLKFIQYLPTMYLILPTKFRFNIGPALQPIAGSMPANRLRRWPITDLSQGLLYTVSMLTHSLRRWPVIETALGDCTVFSDCWIMVMTFQIPASKTPDNTIHWPNAEAMLGHRLRRWANIIPTKTL